MKQREKCGTCLHGAHTLGKCHTVTVTPVPDGESIETPCACEESTPYRNGKEVV